MASYDRGFSTSSPVLGIQSQSTHHLSFNQQVPTQPCPVFNATRSWSASSQFSSRPSFAGRKRCRDEAASNLDEPEKITPAPVIDPLEDDWEYGPGMVLIKKKTGYATDASSQSGTWLEERAADEHAKKTEAAILAQKTQSQTRPSLRSNKSQRLDTEAAQIIPLFAAEGQPVSGRERSPESSTQPIVDAFTVHLGIGWKKLSDDEHIQAAARGWARFIENHYPITNATIRLESTGLQSYLVEASEGYFLFDENLRQGRLVSVGAERALQNLKSSPPVFDGVGVMTANDNMAASPPLQQASSRFETSSHAMLSTANALTDTEMSLA